MRRTMRQSGALTSLFALTVTVVAGAAGALAGPAAPAAASVPGIENLVHSTLATSSDKTATITCPDGKKVIDAGGYIQGGGGKVIMDDVFPDPNLNFVNVTGLETDSYGGSWSAVASVTCADPPPGLEWIEAQTASNSSTTKTLTVACSPGKTVLGNGYTITGGDGEAWVDEAVPNGGPGVAATQVSLIGVEGDDFSGDWTLSGFLMCANPLAGQQVLSVTTAHADTGRVTEPQCAGLQIATGSTAELLDGSGTVVLTEDMVIDDNRTAWAYGEVNDEPDPDWRIRSYVFCVDR
jgi:hypothetical protein